MGAPLSYDLQKLVSWPLMLEGGGCVLGVSCNVPRQEGGSTSKKVNKTLLTFWDAEMQLQSTTTQETAT